jgi:hypothetical protein
LARRQLESVLAGGNGDGGIQLRPGGGGASSSAGERLAVATAEWHRLWTAMGSRFCTFDHLHSFLKFLHSAPFTFCFFLSYFVKFLHSANFYLYFLNLPIFGLFILYLAS